MATSDSDDFESADEELIGRNETPSKKVGSQWKKPSSAIDSESDDDNESMPVVNQTPGRNSATCSVQTSGNERRSRSYANVEKKGNTKTVRETENPDQSMVTVRDAAPEINIQAEIEEATRKLSLTKEDSIGDGKDVGNLKEKQKQSPETLKSVSDIQERQQHRHKSKEAKTLDEMRKKVLAEERGPPIIEECWEFNEEETAKILQSMKNIGLGGGETVKMPEELTSEKKFKEIFKPDGWEDLDDAEILAELEEQSPVEPVLDKIASAPDEESSLSSVAGSWASWGSWGVGSLINSATVGVSSLTSHVTHGLTLLDQAVGANLELIETDVSNKNAVSIEDKPSTNIQDSQLSFGFNDLMSGVSSITKLVESTGSRVITGGLGTLETIGKKTMQVLQEGDPGLKKKRAFFLNEGDKPILSQMLREAKEKAQLEEETLEEKQSSRKIHFESLFDDYQGLVHLEALEMLSKRCNIKIHQRLVALDADELASIQETLEEVKELCDLGDEDDTRDNNDDLQERLSAACKDLGVTITYEKIDDIWKDTQAYLSEISSPESDVTERRVVERAVSTLARLTAFSVERFHKTAELLLIKERRSTVNEADALVQLAKILSGQISTAANAFSSWFNDRAKLDDDKSHNKSDITTIFFEATNASSYIHDAFRLLIPILQVGAI